MDEQHITFFKAIQEQHGWIIATSVAAIIIIVTVFAKGIVSALGKHLQESILHKGVFSLRKINIENHPIFSKYRYLLNQRLKHIVCRCPLRKKIFIDLMLIRVETYDRMIKEFVKRKDLNQLSVTEFLYATNELVLSIISEWEDTARNKGIPEVVIRKFDEQTNDTRNALKQFMQAVANSTYSYQDNISRMSAILDMLSGYEEAILIKLEESMALLNGEISESSYKGLTCLNCVNCQSKSHKTKIVWKDTKKE